MKFENQIGLNEKLNDAMKRRDLKIKYDGMKK